MSTETYILVFEDQVTGEVIADVTFWDRNTADRIVNLHNNDLLVINGYVEQNVRESL